MKILFDYQIFTLQSYGGISRYYKCLTAELFNLNQDVEILAGIHRNRYISSLPDGIVSGINIKKYPPTTGRLFQYLNHCLTSQQIKKIKPDIIHETYYSIINSKPRTPPRIVTVYDMIHELHANMFNKNDHTTRWKKNAFNRVDHIISISRNTKNDLINFLGIAPEKISVVHLAADSLSYSENYDELFSYRKPFLLYVGSRGGYKNFSGLLKAVSTSKKIKAEFDIITFGGGKFTQKEKKILAALGFDNQQVRQISGDDHILAQLYKNATAFIYPSLYEGFGIPPLEAMACHCPVISSNSSSMPEVIGDAGEFFNPNSIEDMACAIEKVVFSESRMRELKEKGQDRLKLFSWEKCAKETLAVYQKLVG